MKALAPKEKLATRAGLAQFLRFGLVGVANTATSYIVIRLLAEPLGVPAASAIGYAAGVVQSFGLNRFWTFSNTRPRKDGCLGGEAVRFIAVNLACGGLSRWFNHQAAASNAKPSPSRKLAKPQLKIQL